jgi:thiol:disulfide interchange protein
MNRHELDVFSLVCGSVFLAVVAGWLLTRWITLDLPSPGWLVASALVLLGILGLLTTSLHRHGTAAGPDT